MHISSSLLGLVALIVLPVQSQTLEDVASEMESMHYSRVTHRSLTLFQKAPLTFTGTRKPYIYAKKKPNEYQTNNLVTLTRFHAARLPKIMGVAAEPEFVIKDALYEYKDTDTIQFTHWWVNFANKNLFVNYAPDKSFVQDELQCAEFPVLPVLREFLIKTGVTLPLTEEPNDYIPTPVLITGAERHFSIGAALYAHNLEVASQKTIDDNMTVIKPPYVTNILAMSAPKRKTFGKGKPYTLEVITAIFATAYSGFRAVVLQSIEKGYTKHGKPSEAVIHTGNWGAGNFGGNLELMVVLQLAAAKQAKVKKLVGYGAGKVGTETWFKALDVFRNLWPANKAISKDEFLKQVFSIGYTWKAD